MSFASFVSQSKLPSAVRVRLPSSAKPSQLDEAYRATTSPLSADGWTATPPPPPTFSSDDFASPDDLVQSFGGGAKISKSAEKSKESGNLVEWLMIDKEASSTGIFQDLSKSFYWASRTGLVCATLGGPFYAALVERKIPPCINNNAL